MNQDALSFLSEALKITSAIVNDLSKITASAIGSLPPKDSIVEDDIPSLSEPALPEEVPVVEESPSLMDDWKAMAMNVVRGNDVKELREAMGISGSEFARMLNKTPANVHRWESKNQSLNELSRGKVVFAVLDYITAAKEKQAILSPSSSSKGSELINLAMMANEWKDIKVIRKRMRLSQAEFARILGYSSSSFIHTSEKVNRKLSTSTKTKLTDAVTNHVRYMIEKENALSSKSDHGLSTADVWRRMLSVIDTGKDLKILRESMGMNKTQLSMKMGTTPTTIWNQEKYNQAIRVKTKEALARVVEERIAELS